MGLLAAVAAGTLAALAAGTLAALVTVGERLAHALIASAVADGSSSTNPGQCLTGAGRPNLSASSCIHDINIVTCMGGRH